MFLNHEPEVHELQEIIEQYNEAGFLGFIGCLDCMHVKWKNCLRSLKGQYHNPKERKIARISYEALCDRNLHCWNWYAGRCGGNNDISVLDNSPLVNDILATRRQVYIPGGYKVNGELRLWLLYILVDDIYPPWAIFVGPNHSLVNEKQLNMTKRQEAVRKNIEGFFGCW